ncbi:MAG: Lactate utilization protein C [Candidatus Latescibacteria bacterium ADurb.Bin168]|nr:MAG: Lactate utilization protein C [Candidatus Latescibacteria bacterium ADurb.Bin168]
MEEEPEARLEFLQRVCEAAARGLPERPTSGSLRITTEVGRSVRDGKLADMFIENARAAGIDAQIVPTRTAVADAVNEIARTYSIRTLHAWNDGTVDRYSLGTLAEMSGLEIQRWNPEQPEESRKAAAFGMQCGLTSADYAIAETGSLVLTTSREKGRSVSLLGDVHIAIVEADRLIPDLYDLPQRLLKDHPALLPSNVTVISGPSKTADIELQMVVGVHGPRHVFAILVQGD